RAARVPPPGSASSTTGAPARPAAAGPAPAAARSAAAGRWRSRGPAWRRVYRNVIPSSMARHRGRPRLARVAGATRAPRAPGGAQTGGRSARRQAELAGQEVDELPRGAPRAAILPGRPLERAPPQLGRVDRDAPRAGEAAHDPQVAVLVGGAERDRDAEAVGERQLLLLRVRRVDLVEWAAAVREPLEHEVTAVRRGVQQHVGRARLDAALEHRLQVLVVARVVVEREVVD